MTGPDDATDRVPGPERAPAGGGRVTGRTRRIVRYVLLAITVVLLADAVVGERGLLALLQARREYDAVERALQRAREDNASLRETARRLREDPAAIESLARKDLGMIRPGEKVFIIRDARPAR